MFQLDANINAALQRQAEHVRAVQAHSQDAAAARGAGPFNSLARQLTLAVAAVPVIALLIWGVLAQ